MDDKEKVLSFGDMVNATMKINKPWIIICGLLLAALVLTNAIWGFVHWKQLQYAYLTPEEISQTQNFDEHRQEQHYGQGATQGEVILATQSQWVRTGARKPIAPQRPWALR